MFTASDWHGHSRAVPKDMRTRKRHDRETASHLHSEPVAESVAHPKPDSVEAALKEEEPLPFLEAGMALWRLSIAAVVVAPLSLLALAAAPVIIVRKLFSPVR